MAKHRLGTKQKMGLVAIIAAMVVGAIIWFFSTVDIAVLSPKGVIAAEQRELLIFAVLLSLVIVVPVFIMTFFIAWKYRAGNKKARYSPDWDHNRIVETIWWGIPILIISILAVVAWQSSHRLDPHRPLASAQKPLRVQVVALQWNWLFIYPDQDIATLNYLKIPKDTPINLELTADAPMNSFWVPELGGQIYAMAGMSTRLHLMASELGEFEGSSANLSGQGFADMHFKVISTEAGDFEAWAKATKNSPDQLTTSTYTELARPKANRPKAAFAAPNDQLYTTIIMKYTAPPEGINQ